MKRESGMKAIANTWAPGLVHALLANALRRNGIAMAMGVLQQTSAYVVTECRVRRVHECTLRPFEPIRCVGCSFCTN